MDTTVFQSIAEPGTGIVRTPNGREIDLHEFLAFRVFSPLIDNPAVTPEMLISMVEYRTANAERRELLVRALDNVQNLSHFQD